MVNNDLTNLITERARSSNDTMCMYPNVNYLTNVRIWQIRLCRVNGVLIWLLCSAITQLIITIYWLLSFETKTKPLHALYKRRDFILMNSFYQYLTTDLVFTVSEPLAKLLPEMGVDNFLCQIKDFRPK